MRTKSAHIASSALPALAVVAGLALAANAADAQTGETTLWYGQHFEGNLDAENWSDNLPLYRTGPLTRFAGRLGQDAATLTIPAAPELRVPRASGQPGPEPEPNPEPNPEPKPEPNPTTLYALTFDLFIFDTWDGSEPNYGLDTITVTLNNDIIFEETFANQHDWQTFRQPDVRTQLGFGSQLDSIYRDITIPFQLEPDVDTIELSWIGGTNQTITDESWGFDNVRINRTVVVPAPGSAALIGLGTVLAARRQRRD